MGPPKHVLLVEDNDLIRKVTQLALEALGGHRVTACASGAEALRSAPGQIFDLLLLDVVMPDMRGPETLMALRKLPGLGEVPAVLLTARTQAKELEEYRRYGVTDVISKPFDPQSLCDRIARVWNRDAGGDLHPNDAEKAARLVAPEALVVEDDAGILYLMQFILEQQGCRVRSAGGGRGGREAIGHGPGTRAAIVVLDLTLPDVDGLELLGTLRADPRWDGVPVLVLSARRDEDTMGRVFAAGADDYLCKPFDPQQAAERIKRLIQARRSGTRGLGVAS